MLVMNTLPDELPSWRPPTDPFVINGVVIDWPTIGWSVLKAFKNLLIIPDGPSTGLPLTPTAEQALFILRFYAINPRYKGPFLQAGRFVNARRIRRAVLSRPKGWGKSPFVGGLAAIEACEPVILNHWSNEYHPRYGSVPVLEPWHQVGFKPKVQIMAISEDQTVNTWEPIQTFFKEGPIGQKHSAKVMDSVVVLPNVNAKIEQVTSSSLSREGFRPVFVIMDQTESWTPERRGGELASVQRRNLGKTSGSSVETPNAFIPGRNSVAERSHKAWQLQASGALKGDEGLLYDHREMPPEINIGEREQLEEGLKYVYGDSIKFVDIDRLIEEIWDPDTDPSDSERFYCNRHSAAADAWLSRAEVQAIMTEDEPLPFKSMVTLGFDGSRGRSDRKKADATALIISRVSDGKLYTKRIWEQPSAGIPWVVPRDDVIYHVEECFRLYNVVGFYADPATWEDEIADWESRFGRRLKLKVNANHPMSYHMAGGTSLKIVRATLALKTGIQKGLIKINGDPLGEHLANHIVNARTRPTRFGDELAKSHPDSADKIDGAIGALLANAARQDAVAKGFNKVGSVSRVA